MTLQLEVGKYYKDRQSRVRGPIQAIAGHAVYSFSCSKVGIMYTASGSVAIGTSPHDPDLVSECDVQGNIIGGAPAPAPLAALQPQWAGGRSGNVRPEVKFIPIRMFEYRYYIHEHRQGLR